MQWVQCPGVLETACVFGNIALSHTELWGPVPLFLWSWLCSEGGRQGLCRGPLQAQPVPLEQGSGRRLRTQEDWEGRC